MAITRALAILIRLLSTPTLSKSFRVSESTAENVANGLAFVDGNGTAIHIGDNLPTFEMTIREMWRPASVAHEIGHNLGLNHVSNHGQS